MVHLNNTKKNFFKTGLSFHFPFETFPLKHVSFFSSGFVDLRNAKAKALDGFDRSTNRREVEQYKKKFDAFDEDEGLRRALRRSLLWE